MSAPTYDRIGLHYSEVRHADPRFAAAIRGALGDTVVEVRSPDATN